MIVAPQVRDAILGDERSCFIAKSSCMFVSPTAEAAALHIRTKRRRLQALVEASRDRDRGHRPPEAPLRATARGSGFRRLQSIDGIAVIPPTIEAADQLLYEESELEHVQRAFCRAVTANPITVRNDQGPFIKVGRRGRTHHSTRDINRAGCRLGALPRFPADHSSLAIFW